MRRSEKLRCALPALWSCVLAVLMLWQALLPGFVLSYDMVWVPDLALRADLLGTGSALPRAVPSDAAVAVVDEVVPGMVLQKLVLLGALVGGGIGAARLVGPLPLAAQLAAVSVYQWNPFVIERLVLGHWPVLLAYAALPWLLGLAGSVRRTRRFPAMLCVVLPLASLSASAGLMAALATLAAGLGRHTRTNLILGGAVLLANGPWIGAGLLHAGEATTDPIGAEVFALQDVGWLPGPLAALGLGGTWNAEVVPDTRTGALGVVALVAILALAALGVRSWWRSQERRTIWALAVCWGVGWGVAVLTWAVPDAMGVVYDRVPGSGLVRDGARMLALTAPLLTVLVAHGVAAVWTQARRSTPARIPAGLACVLLPVAVLPDAAWGAAGALQPVDYPDSYERARQFLATTQPPEPGDVVVLPFTSYRAPEWNHGHKVLDPLGRYLRVDYVVNDELSISQRVVEGEDPRAADVRAALARPTRQARAEGLAEIGVGSVVTDEAALDPRLPEDRAPQVAGSRHDLGGVEVLMIDEAVARPSASGGVLALLWGVWAGFAALVLVGLCGLARGLTRRLPRGRVR